MTTAAIKNKFLFFLIGIFILLFASCSRNIHKQAPDEIVIFPVPPDTTRIQFLTSISSSLNVTAKRTAFAKYLLGEVKPLPIYKPYGIAIHKGKLFITDSGVRGLEIMNLNKKTFNYFTPKGMGQFKFPINCSVDKENGNLYVADMDRHQIVVFDSTEKYLNSFGEIENTKPSDVCAYGGKIWVSDSKSHKINVYDRDSLKLLYSFPKAEPTDTGFLFQPINICVTEDKVYVTDIGDSKIKMYSHDGKFISAVGNMGTNMGQFARPKGITVDREGNLYVVDAAFENVQIFNKERKLLMAFGGPYVGPGYMWLPANVEIDYDNLKYFKKYVDPAFDLKYLIFVTNQYGPDKINVYGYVEPSKTNPLGVTNIKPFIPKTNDTAQSKKPVVKFEEIDISAGEPVDEEAKQETPHPVPAISEKKETGSTAPAETAKTVAAPITEAIPPVPVKKDTIAPAPTIIIPETKTTTSAPPATTVIFRVQIAAAKNPLPVNHSAFQNVSGKIENEKGDDGWIRYYIGSYKKPEEANTYLNELKSKGGNGIIVAFKDGKKIALLDAMAISPRTDAPLSASIATNPAPTITTSATPPVAPSVDSKVIFRVQIAAAKNPLPANHAAFKNISDKIENEKGDDEWIRYYIGSYKKLDDATTYLNELKSKGGNGMVVAFKDGKKIALSDAMAISPRTTPSLSVSTATNPTPTITTSATPPVAPSVDSKVIFRLQIAASQIPLPANHAAFKNISEKIENEKSDDGWIRYYIGSYKKPEEANTYLNELKSKGGNGIIVAFKDGKKIALSDAMAISPRTDAPLPASIATNPAPTITTYATPPVAPSVDSKVIFRVQIAASQNPLPANHDAFKNISDKIENEKGDDEWIRYYVGSYKKLDDATTYLNELKSKGGNGMVVAFKDGKKIPVLDAKKLTE